MKRIVAFGAVFFVAILLTVFAFNFTGDALLDTLDPRLQKRG